VLCRCCWYCRTVIRLPDGGTLGIDMAPCSKEATDLPADTPIVVVQHGLTGGSYEPYVRSILAGAIAPKSAGGLGLRAFVVNFRGCQYFVLFLANPACHRSSHQFQKAQIYPLQVHRYVYIFK